MFERHQLRTGQFAAERKALNDAQNDEKDGRPHANLSVGRQQSHEHGRRAHDRHGKKQQRAAPEPVAEIAADDGAERTRGEADAESGQGSQQA